MVRKIEPSRRRQDEGIPARDAAELVEIPYTTLDYWSRTGYYRAELIDGEGRGRFHGRRYSNDDLRRLMIVRNLRDMGFSLQCLRRVSGLKSLELDKDWLVTNGDRFITTNRSEVVLTLTNTARGYASVNLRDVRKKIKKALAEKASETAE
jgi:DNA-binding transcriptional MerR regulator